MVDKIELTTLLNSISNLKVLVIGEGIIDEYNYVEQMGKSGKSPIVVNKYISNEVHAGGIFAVANNAANLYNKVHLISMIGSENEDSMKQFILNHLDIKIYPKFIIKPDSPTIRKVRYISNNQKLFEVNYINDTPIDSCIETKIIDYLNLIIQDYELVIVSDFGHGFITPKIIRCLENSKKLAVNAQTNSANQGFNLITKYKYSNFICVNETEARLATQMKFEPIEEVAKNLITKFHQDMEMLIITLGKEGSITITSDGILRTPAFKSNTIDTVGTGDAFFVFSSLCFATGATPELTSTIGNAAGALASQIVGNRKSIKKGELIDYICKINS